MKGPIIFGACILALAAIPGGSLYYTSGTPDSCAATCHEIRPNTDTWHLSTHRTVPCKGCHDSTTLGNLRRLVTHTKGDIPEKIRLSELDVEKMSERCQSCHRQEFANWKSGGHATIYSKIFLDTKHNTHRLLMDDCLRCHGMFFEGGIRDLVTPVAMKGPWQLKDTRLATVPAIPCLACHAMHREGAPASAKPTLRPSLALWDRREADHLPIASMALPAMKEGDRLVKMSPDPRQALCYQCHAALANAQVWSGDDRTAVGVHEGLSCLACHEKHAQTTRASCATCHPRLSNCGLDVEKMDTTYRDLKSRFNIHTVKCVDCHPKGVPQRRVQAALR
jgi:hypothetical protein